MEWFPDPFKPLSDKSAADLANEYWVFNEVTKGDTESEEAEGEFDFGNASNVPPVEPGVSGSGKRVGCGWVFLVLVVLALLGLAIDSCGDSTGTYREYPSTTTVATSRYTSSQYTSSQTTNDYEYTTEHRYTSRYSGYITRKSTSRTKEDFYGVDDYVDAADFADEMHDEFDDWEDAFDYYEEYAE